MATSVNVIIPELREDNPYYFGSVFIFPDGSMALDRAPVIYSQSDKDRYFTVGDGDEIDPIAYEAYSNSKFWWLIADVNNILFPFELNIGDTLVIPDLDQIQIANL